MNRPYLAAANAMLVLAVAVETWIVSGTRAPRVGVFGGITFLLYVVSVVMAPLVMAASIHNSRRPVSFVPRFLPATMFVFSVGMVAALLAVFVGQNYVLSDADWKLLAIVAGLGASAMLVMGWLALPSRFLWPSILRIPSATSLVDVKARQPLAKNR